MSATGLVRGLVSWGAAMALIAGLLPLVPVPTTGAAEAIGIPFPDGQAVRIIQGYNGGSHRGRSQYALDLVLASGSTSGAEVISPIEGSVPWAFAPGAGNGCMAIAFRDGRYSLVLCHVLFHRAYRRGESITRGQSLGTIGPAGTVGNNGLPHLHLELHRGGGSSSPVPFSPPDGLPLESGALPASGASSEHSSRAPLVSTNRARGEAQAAGSAQQLRAASDTAQAQPVPARSAPLQQASAAALVSADRRDRSSSSGEAARKSSPARAAVVHGTEACLNVREKPSVDARIVACLPEGTEVPLMAAAQGTDARWRQIEAKGWAASQYLRRTRAVVTGAESCLNVREHPSTSAPVLGCLREGTSVTIAEGPTSGEAFDWYRIEPSQALGKVGWVVGQYLD